MKTAIGITFSSPHLRSLGISPLLALEAAFDCHFSHIRLGAYWSEIEKAKDIYDFTELNTILTKCEAAKQSVVMTVGVKAPRWPEYYFPSHITVKDPGHRETQNAILKFITSAVGEMRHYSCITHWQIENEPLDPSGPLNMMIPQRFLQKEIETVKSIDIRPIIVTVWGNDLKRRGLFPIAEELGDVIGIDLYYRQYSEKRFGRTTYRGPDCSDRYLSNLINDAKKPVWITELQAEPWEKDNETYLTDFPKSMSPLILEEHIKRAHTLPVKEILLWGFEYWAYRAQKGDRSFLDLVEATFHG